MPGEVIELEGDARALVAAVIHLDGYDFALIGGLAVMVRLQEAHRVTSDLDGVFDNPTDVPTTATLIAAGIARDAPAPQRVIVLDTDVDVIDTFALPDLTADLPDDPKDRLLSAPTATPSRPRPLFVFAPARARPTSRSRSRRP